MKRIFHRHEKCEEYAAGMWRNLTEENKEHYISATASLMKNSPEFLSAMKKAVDKWPNSCEQNLTAHSINHRAWLGHAGCCISVNSPEDLTRLGWHTLTEPEQNEANAMADLAYLYWKESYGKRKCQNANLELMF